VRNRYCNGHFRKGQIYLSKVNMVEYISMASAELAISGEGPDSERGAMEVAFGGCLISALRAACADREITAADMYADRRTAQSVGATVEKDSLVRALSGQLRALGPGEAVTFT
jgi:hypothetical protein